MAARTCGLPLMRAIREADAQAAYWTGPSARPGDSRVWYECGLRELLAGHGAARPPQMAPLLELSDVPHGDPAVSAAVPGRERSSSAFLPDSRN